MFSKPEYFEGEWEFKDYYPQNCAQKASCFTKKMGFQLDKTNPRKNHWYCFNTKA